MPKFNLRRLEIFRAVYMAGSVSGAARQLGISQPSVSRHLKYYEQQIGLQLFKMSKGRLVPMREADELYKATAGVFDEVDHVATAIDRLRRGDGESLSVMVSGTIMSSVMPSITQIMSELRPGLRFEYRIGSSAEQARALQLGNVDIGLNASVTEISGVLRTPIASASLMVQMHHQHPLAARDVISLRELSQWPSIGGFPDGPMSRLIRPYLDAAGVDLTHNVCVDFNPIMPQMIEATRGISLVGSLSVLADTTKNTVVRPLEDDIRYDFSVFTLESGRDSQTLREFVTIAKSAVEKAISSVSLDAA
ncbi:MAG: LysR family transcriptional regulator [Rhodospirillaceae bacterium]|nr:LysR family transcriptional regulator [Rhodospirillaceae bacterium]